MLKITITETKKLALPKSNVSDAVMEEFKKNLKEYIASLDTAIENGENEEHIKTIINEFLKINSTCAVGEFISPCNMT